MTTSVATINAAKLNCTDDPFDAARIGDWYWVELDNMVWDKKKGKVKKGTYKCLMCIEEIGSNYFGFTVFKGDKYHRSTDVKVHFNKFIQTCTPAPDWREHLNKEMAAIQKQMSDKMRELIKEGQNVALLPPDDPLPVGQQEQSFLPVKATVNHKEYKKGLVALRDKVPKVSEEISELGQEFAAVAKNMALPDLCKMGAVKKALAVVEDRIFTVELYCGILEEVHQIAKGDPAPVATPVAVRQQLLFMDEETLFDYHEGGMDFSSLEKFDKWVVKPENLQRILPEQRGIVGMRIRRSGKDYGPVASLWQAWAHAEWNKMNMQTYLLIRNGGNVYRIASEIDFSPRLIPLVGEIGKDQFLKIDSKYVWKNDPPGKKWGTGGTHELEETVEQVTPDSVEYDAHVRKVDSLLKHYNRIVILIQGLLDRSMVFHPHPPINLRKPEDMEKWVVLMRDEERGLPTNKVNWEEYHKRLNATLRKGKWICVDSKYDEGYKDGEAPGHSYSGRHYEPPRRRGFGANVMPDLIKVDAVKRDRTMVRVSWPWGKRARPKDGRWIESPTRPGWGHYESIWETDRMCHEWIPINRVFNMSDYLPGDYRMFLCDRVLQGQYLRWAQYLLTAEAWAQRRIAGKKPEDDDRAQVRG